MRPVAGWLVALSMMAAPVIAVGGGGDYDPCRNKGTRRIAIVFAKSPAGSCAGKVIPFRKQVCEGETVHWSVINGCDTDQVADVLIKGLERVAEKCSTIDLLEVGGSKEITCELKKGFATDIRQKYDVGGRIGKGRTVVDPELDIRRPD
jgi:hypothetical protein